MTYQDMYVAIENWFSQEEWREAHGEVESIAHQLWVGRGGPLGRAVASQQFLHANGISAEAFLASFQRYAGALLAAREAGDLGQSITVNATNSNVAIRSPGAVQSVRVRTGDSESLRQAIAALGLAPAAVSQLVDAAQALRDAGGTRDGVGTEASWLRRVTKNAIEVAATTLAGVPASTLKMLVEGYLDSFLG